MTMTQMTSRLLLAIGLLAALQTQSGCTREPQRSGQSDQPVGSRVVEGGVQGEAADAGANPAAPAPQTGDARMPASSEKGATSQTQPTTSQAKRDLGAATSVGTVGSDKVADQGTAPTDTGTMPRDRKGIVGSPTASNIGATQPTNVSSQIDVSRYSYDRKNEFKSFMQARLQGVDRDLKTLKTKTNAPKGGGDTVLNDLSKQESALMTKLGAVDTVRPENWDAYKRSFRDDVAVLERSVQDLSTTSR